VILASRRQNTVRGKWLEVGGDSVKLFEGFGEEGAHWRRVVNGGTTRAEGIEGGRLDQWSLVVSWGPERYVTSGACSGRRCRRRTVAGGAGRSCGAHEIRR
jgi:hypothetical protein